MCPHVRGLGIGLGYWLSRRHRIPNLNTHSIVTYNARPFFRQTMCLRVCPRSRPPHREKNYIKFPVRDFVNPLDVAWSVLKQDYPRSINFGPDGPTSLSGSPTGPIPSSIGSDYVIPEGGTLCAFGGVNCRKAATTATKQGVPMCESCLKTYEYGKFDQFQDPSLDGSQWGQYHR